MGINGRDLTEVATRRLRDNASLILSYQVLADFCHVTAKSATGWMGGSKPLGGEYTLRLWYFLDALGLEQPELVKVRKEYEYGAYIGELLAYSVVSMHEACQFGVSTKEEGSVQEGAILRATRDESRITRQSMNLDSLKELYDEPLKEAKARLQDELQSWRTVENAAMMVRAEESEQEPAPADTTEDVQRMFRILIERLDSPAKPRIVEIAEIADILLRAQGAATLAVYEFTAEERSKLREMMGDGGMFVFSNLITMLCSERAREKGLDK